MLSEPNRGWGYTTTSNRLGHLGKMALDQDDDSNSNKSEW